MNNIPNLLALIILFSAACSDNRPLNSGNDSTGDLGVVIRMGKLAQATISRAEAVVTASDMTPISQSLTVTGNIISGILKGIPAGRDRLFTLNAYDSSGNLAYSGSEKADVIAGIETTLRVTMRSVNSANSPVDVILNVSESASITRSSINNNSRVTFELSNSGSSDATNVSMNFRSRNRNGVAVSDASFSIDTVEAGSSILVDVSFSRTSYFSSDSNYITKTDFTLTYDQGDDITGTINIR